MSDNLAFILRRSLNIKLGILRLTYKTEKYSLVARAVGQVGNYVILFQPDSKEDLPAVLTNMPATLVQKTRTGYVHMAGHVTINKKDKSAILSLNIEKAHCFARKGSDKDVFLEEICSYHKVADTAFTC
jgi:hypothetical protein